MAKIFESKIKSKWQILESTVIRLLTRKAKLWICLNICLVEFTAAWLQFPSAKWIISILGDQLAGGQSNLAILDYTSWLVTIWRIYLCQYMHKRLSKFIKASVLELHQLRQKLHWTLLLIFSYYWRTLHLLLAVLAQALDTITSSTIPYHRWGKHFGFMHSENSPLSSGACTTQPKFAN